MSTIEEINNAIHEFNKIIGKRQVSEYRELASTLSVSDEAREIVNSVISTEARALSPLSGGFVRVDGIIARLTSERIRLIRNRAELAQ